MLRQARAQARTAVQLARLHPHWRTYLATGDNPVQRLLHKWMRVLFPARAGNARRLAADAYFEELERARRAAAP